MKIIQITILRAMGLVLNIICWTYCLLIVAICAVLLALLFNWFPAFKIVSKLLVNIYGCLYSLLEIVEDTIEIIKES